MDVLRFAITGYIHDLIRRAQPIFARADGYVMLVQFLILMRKYENRCTYFVRTIRYPARRHSSRGDCHNADLPCRSCGTYLFEDL